MNDYLRVMALMNYFDSDDSDGKLYNYKPMRKKSSVEFGSLFKVACDELKQQSGITHHQEGYAVV